jgi:hypothetical protein
MVSWIMTRQFTWVNLRQVSWEKTRLVSREMTWYVSWGKTKQLKRLIRKAQQGKD